MPSGVWVGLGACQIPRVIDSQAAACPRAMIRCVWQFRPKRQPKLTQFARRLTSAQRTLPTFPLRPEQPLQRPGRRPSAPSGGRFAASPRRTEVGCCWHHKSLRTGVAAPTRRTGTVLCCATGSVSRRAHRGHLRRMRESVFGAVAIARRALRFRTGNSAAPSAIRARARRSGVRRRRAPRRSPD